MYVHPLLHFLRLRCILLSQSTFLASKPYMTKNVKGPKESKKKKIVSAYSLSQNVSTLSFSFLIALFVVKVFPQVAFLHSHRST